MGEVGVLKYSHCVGCGSELVLSSRNRNPKKWCSESCRVAAYRRKNPDYVKRCAELNRVKQAENESMKPPKPCCVNCGEELFDRRDGRKFCGRPECRKAKRKYAKAHAPECSLDGCSRPCLAKGMCSSHYSREWAKRNPDKRLILNQRYRANKKSAWVEDVDRFTVMERDGWMCGICKKSIPVDAIYPDANYPSLDHVVPLSKGGEHSYANIQAAHLLCNALKSDSLDEDGLVVV